MMRRLKRFLAAIVNSHPYFWFVAWRLMPHLKFMLPHEKSYYAFKHLLAQKDGLFLDVGANDGMSARGFRHLIPGYRILSIEANRLHEPALRRLKEKLSGFNYIITAAGEKAAEFKLYTAIYRGMALHTGSSLNLDHLKSGLMRVYPPRVVRNLSYHEQTVQVMKLDDLGVRPDIIKIDAEGSDFQVLAGLRSTIAACRPSILIEYSQTLQGKLEPFCRESAYALLAYDELEDRFSAFDAEREMQAHSRDPSPVNLFMVPRERLDTLPMAAT